LHRNPRFATIVSVIGYTLRFRDRKRSVPMPVPTTTVNQTALENPSHHAPQLTWLGHACFLLQVKGVSVLTDPIFSDRCSPVQFAGPKRFTPAPLAVPLLPKVDIVIISYGEFSVSLRLSGYYRPCRDDSMFTSLRMYFLALLQAQSLRSLGFWDD
jgi:hypothetical protein